MEFIICSVCGSTRQAYMHVCPHILDGAKAAVVIPNFFHGHAVAVCADCPVPVQGEAPIATHCLACWTRKNGAIAA